MTIEEMLATFVSPATQVSILVGLAEVIKNMGVPNRFVPLVDLVLGVSMGIYTYGYTLGYGVAKGALIGMSLGLEACGLFSGVKNILGK